MEEFLNLTKRNWQVITINTLVLLVGVMIIKLFNNISSEEFQQSLVNSIVFDSDSLIFTATEASKSLAIIGYQLILFICCAGLLKIFPVKNNTIIVFIIVSIITLLISIVLTNISFPYFKRLAAINSIDYIKVSSIPGINFFKIQLKLWFLLNAALIPVFLKYLGLYKDSVRPKNLIILFGIIFLIASKITPSDIFSQLLVAIILSLFGLLGFWVSKLFRIQYPTLEADNNKNLFYILNSAFIILWLFLLDIGSFSIPEAIIIISVLMLIQNLIIINKIYQRDRVSSIKALVIPFYLPYYILKNIREVFNNRLSYKIYAVILIVLTFMLLLRFFIE